MVFDNPLYNVLPNVIKPHKKWTWRNGSSITEIAHVSHTYLVYLGKSVFASPSPKGECSADVIWFEMENHIIIYPNTVSFNGAKLHNFQM